MANFGELLSELRQDRHMTQRELAKVFHVSTGTISNYEKNVHLPDVEKLGEIAAYFDVTVDYLLGRTPYSISPSAMEEKLLDGLTTHEVISIIQTLSSEQKRSLRSVMEAFSFNARVTKR